MKALVILLFLSSCVMLQTSDELAQVLPKAKQKQKIALLEKKLQRAEKEQRKVEKEVGRLSNAVKEAQLSLIQKQIEEYRKAHPQKLNPDEIASCFFKEREILHEMVLDGPSFTAFEAQKVLDRLLEMITELSDVP